MIRPSPRQRAQATMFTIWPRIVWATRRCSPVPLQSGQVSGWVPGSPPDPLAARTGHERREADRLRDAEDGLGKVDRQVVAQVGAGHDPLTPPRAGRGASEERVEDVTEWAEPTTEALEAARGRAVDARVAEHVVCRPPLPVRQDAVRLVQLLEPLLGTVAAVDVGMVALGEATEGALDLRLVGVLRHTQDVVVVTLHGHRVADSTNWHSRSVSASL